MKKRLAALLSVMLIFALALSIPVFAAEDDATDPAGVTETEGTEAEGTETEATEPEATEPEGTEPAAFPFTDVPEGEYFYAPIKAVYELELIKGMTDTTFGPAEKLTIAQAIVFAVRMNVYFDEAATAPANATEGNWYDTFVAYAIDKGIIAEDTFADYSANVTRAQMAFLFVGAVPEMTVVNEEAAAPDVEGNAYAEYINAFYKAGILQGVDADGNYTPDSEIVRRDVATIIYRLVDETQRIGYTAPEAPAADDGNAEAPAPAADGTDTAEGGNGEAADPTGTAA